VAEINNPELANSIVRAFQASHDFIALIDSDARIVWANDALAAKHGTGSDNLTGQHFNKLFDSNLADLTQDILITIINDGFFHGELFMHGEDASFPASVSASIVPCEDSDYDFMILFFASDRTYLKQHEEEARKRKEFFGTIISRAPVGIFCLDIDGNLTVINNVMLKMGKKAEIHLREGKNIDKYKDMFNPKIIEVIEKGLLGRKSDLENIPLLADDRSKPIVNIIGAPVFSPEGGIEGVAVLIEDRTEKILIEEKLQETSKLASIGEIAAGVAHTINNPMTTITGRIEMMKMKAEKNHRNTESIDIILHNLERISQIAKGLLDYSRKDVDVEGEVNINDLVKQTVLFFLPHYTWINIDTGLDPDMPVISCDSGKIEQVLHDLFLNAVQAVGKKGSITFSTEFDTAAKEIVIRITDTGSGIAEKNLDKIFDLFFTTKDPGKGTGLGLPVSMTIIKQHGGTIVVEETSEKGTTFAIRLPISNK